MMIGGEHVDIVVGPPPRRAEDAPPARCGEGLGVGGLPVPIGSRWERVRAPSTALRSPPPCPSPSRGEGTLGLGPSSSFRAERCEPLTNPRSVALIGGA